MSTSHWNFVCPCNSIKTSSSQFLQLFIFIHIRGNSPIVSSIHFVYALLLIDNMWWICEEFCDEYVSLVWILCWVSHVRKADIVTCRLVCIELKGHCLHEYINDDNMIKRGKCNLLCFSHVIHRMTLEVNPLSRVALQQNNHFLNTFVYGNVDCVGI